LKTSQPKHERLNVYVAQVDLKKTKVVSILLHWNGKNDVVTRGYR